MNSTKACIACAERINSNALLCKHCRTKQDDSRFTGELASHQKDSHPIQLLRSPLLWVPIVVVAFLLSSWAGLAMAFPDEIDPKVATASLTVETDSEGIPTPTPTPTPTQAEIGANSEQETSAPTLEEIEQLRRTEAIDEVQRKMDEYNRQVQEENDRLEAERKAQAIADYEASLNYHLSQIGLYEKLILDLTAERDAAYADFEAKHGSPYVRYQNNCGNADDFHACVRDFSGMRRFDEEIARAEDSIYFQNIRVGQLAYPD